MIEEDYVCMEDKVEKITDNVSGIGKQLENYSIPSNKAYDAIELISIINVFMERNSEPESFKNLENVNNDNLMI